MKSPLMTAPAVAASAVSASVQHVASAINWTTEPATIMIEGNKYELCKEFSAQNVEVIAGLLAHGITSGQKVGVLEEIITAMYKFNMAWTESCTPEQAGVHPGNRSSFGVGGTEAQQLGFDILSVGWSWNKCSDAMAVHVPPAPLDVAGSAYNASLADVSDGLIPPTKIMRCLTVGGGHTNVFLRQCLAGVRCINEEKDFP